MKSIISDLKQEKNKIFEEKNLVIKDLREEIDKWKFKVETYERDLLSKSAENENFKKNIEEIENKSEGYKKKLQELE
jgi:chromosome segregation ATPase